MNIAVIDTNYRHEEHIGLAASWLIWRIEKSVHVLTKTDIADVVLVTASSQQAIGTIAKAIKKIDRNKAKIYVGGGCSYAPSDIGKLVDAVCVGEGGNFIDCLLAGKSVKFLPEAWVDGGKDEVTPSQSFQWDCPPIMHPDGVVRVFESRGCRHKCAFCQTGYERKFIDNPNKDTIEKQINKILLSGHKYDLVTNDASDIAGARDMRAVSVRFEKLKKAMPIDRGMVKTVRIGVEGVSERLRSAVGKPISNRELVDVSENLLLAGVNVRWFFIVGLPLETADDYNGLYSLASDVARFGKGVVSTVFHAFIPQPATPLCVFPLSDNYYEPFDSFRRCFFDGHIHTNRLQIVGPAQYKTRLKNAMTSMAATEEELRRGWWHDDNANWRVKTVLSNNSKRTRAALYEKFLANTKPPEMLKQEATNKKWVGEL